MSTFKQYNQAKIQQNSKYKTRTYLSQSNYIELNDYKKSYQKLQNRLERLNNLFDGIDKVKNSNFRRLSNEKSFSKGEKSKVINNDVKRIKENVDFNKNFRILDSKLRKIRNNFTSQEKLKYNNNPTDNISSRRKKEVVNIKSSDSSEVNLDEITDSILSLNFKVSEPNCNTNKNINTLLNLNYDRGNLDTFTPRNNCSRFSNVLIDKNIFSDQLRPLSKNSTKTDIYHERTILPEEKLNNGNEYENNINGMYNPINDIKPIENLTTKQNINCFTQNKNEKIVIQDYIQKSNSKAELEDVDFEVSELTPNYKFEDSYELYKKRSDRSTKRKNKFSDILVVQNENNINITGKSGNEDSTNPLHLTEIYKLPLSKEEIYDNKMMHSHLSNAKEEKKGSHDKVILENEERIDRKLFQELNKDELIFKERPPLDKIKKEIDNKNTLETFQTDIKKKVNFNSENQIIIFSDLKDVMNYISSSPKNSCNSHIKSRNKKKIKSILKRPKDLIQEEDPFDKLQDLIRECELDDNKKSGDSNEMKNSSFSRKIRYIDELEKKQNIEIRQKGMKKIACQYQSDDSKTLKEESRFENLSPNKKGTLLKSYISKINIDKLEVDSYKILEEEMDLLGLESNRFSNNIFESKLQSDQETIKAYTSRSNTDKIISLIGSNSNKSIENLKSDSSRYISKPPKPQSIKTLKSSKIKGK